MRVSYRASPEIKRRKERKTSGKKRRELSVTAFLFLPVSELFSQSVSQLSQLVSSVPRPGGVGKQGQWGYIIIYDCNGGACSCSCLWEIRGKSKERDKEEITRATNRAERTGYIAVVVRVVVVAVGRNEERPTLSKANKKRNGNNEREKTEQ